MVKTKVEGSAIATTKQTRDSTIRTNQTKIRVYSHGLSPQTGIGTALTYWCKTNKEIEFEVFVPSSQIGSHYPNNVTAVAVRCLERPLVALYLTFPIGVLIARAARRSRVDPIATIACDGVFPSRNNWLHFSHRFFQSTDEGSSGGSRFRNALRWLDHFVRGVGESHIVKTSRLLIVPSDRLAHELRVLQKAKGKSVVLPNLPEANRVWQFRPAGCSVMTGVLVAGGAFERKGVFTSLRALTEVENIRLRIVGGDAAEVKGAADFAAALGVADRVEFVGRVNNPSEAVGGADFGLFVSTYEVASVALLEAVMGGFPVIASPSGTAATILTPETGVLLNGHTSADIVSGFQILLQNRLTPPSTAVRSLKIQVESEYLAANEAVIRTLSANGPA